MDAHGEAPTKKLKGEFDHNYVIIRPALGFNMHEFTFCIPISLFSPGWICGMMLSYVAYHCFDIA